MTGLEWLTMQEGPIESWRRPSLRDAILVWGSTMAILERDGVRIYQSKFCVGGPASTDNRCHNAATMGRDGLSDCSNYIIHHLSDTMGSCDNDVITVNIKFLDG